MYYLSVLAIFKNETMNLKMWIEHYLWQGVNHFYLIDNASEDNPLTILQEYIDNGILSYFYLPEKHKQTDYYRYVYDNAIKDNSTWLVVCDLDEFFFGLNEPLYKTIKTLEPIYDYIVCNWKMFGSDGLLKHPTDIRRSITHCGKALWKQTKYIIKTNTIHSSDIGIHHISRPELRKYENNLIQLNHYPIQSLEFFQKIKMNRGSACSVRLDNVRNMDYFKRYDYREVQDETLKKLIQTNYKLINKPINKPINKKMNMKFI